MVATSWIVTDIYVVYVIKNFEVLVCLLPSTKKNLNLKISISMEYKNNINKYQKHMTSIFW